MVRARRTEVLVDQELTIDVPADPAPAQRRPGRQRKETSTTQGNRGKVAARTPSGRIMSKAAMQSKVAAELYTYLSLFIAAGELRDPECFGMFGDVVTIPSADGPVQVERLQGVVDRMVAIISRNDTVLATMAQSGIIGELAVIGSLLFPVARQFYRAHGPGNRGHVNEQEAADGYADQYPAYAGFRG